MKWKSLSLVLLVFFSLNGMTQSFKKTDVGIAANVGVNTVEIRFYSDSIVQVIKSPKGRPYSKQSLSVIASTKKIAFAANEQNGFIILKSKVLTVSLNTASGEVKFATATDNPLLQEKPDGIVFTPFNDAGNSTYNVQQSFVLDTDEAIYGLGQQQRGKMNQREQRYHLTQGNTDDAVTFFQSVKGYGVFWDNYSPTDFSDKPDETSFRSEVGDCADYYFMYGGNADRVIAGMRQLTGQAPLFPLWTFGFWQSKERYKSQDEIVGVVKKYRDLKVPLDGIIQDWQYWGDNYHWNAMAFLNPEFPQPQKMVDDIHQMNAHAIISIWSSFGPKTKQYEIMNSKNMLLDFKTWPLSGKDVWPPDMNFPSGVRVYDPYNPEARDIYWNYVNKGLFSLGLDGWWMDSSEPDHLESKPEDMDNKTYLGSYRKVANAYPLMTVGGVYTHQRKTTLSKRVFILTRSAFAGQQRYGANTWSGDLTASWGALKNQISAGLNFSLSGIPYWNSDIGGFFLGNYRKKLADPEYRELYVRWLQFGTFCPMMRSHGTDAPREIYNFGSKGTKAYDAIEKYINLRYSLLPYLYSTSWEVTAHQSSMMRALMMDFATDKNALDINDEFMLGKSLLVAPVTRAQYIKKELVGADSAWVEDFTEAKIKDVYLPAGNDWFDYWTNERHTGGKTVSKETPIDIIPLYVRAGSVLPVGPAVQYATEKKWDSLTIRIYPGANGKFVLYEDENDNYNYEKGVYSTIEFTWNDVVKTLTIANRKGSFPGMLSSRNFMVEMMGEKATNKPGKVVQYNGNSISVKF